MNQLKTYIFNFNYKDFEKTFQRLCKDFAKTFDFLMNPY